LQFHYGLYQYKIGVAHSPLGKIQPWKSKAHASLALINPICSLDTHPIAPVAVSLGAHLQQNKSYFLWAPLWPLQPLQCQSFDRFKSRYLAFLPVAEQLQ